MTDALLLVAGAGGFALRGFPAVLPSRLLVRYVADDAYYYFVLAGHVAAGRGATFDGTAPTNGFHPLYAVLLAGLRRILPPETVVRLAVLLMASVSVATAAVIHALVEPIGGSEAAAVAVVVWLFNPRAILATAQATEAPLYVLGVAATVWLWSGSVRTGAIGDPATLVALGGLLGITFLARSEAVLLGAAVSLDLGVRGWLATGGLPVTSLVLVWMVALVVASPWLAWSRRQSGRFTQTSGDIIAFKRHADVVARLDLLGVLKFAAVAGLNLGHAASLVLHFASGSAGLTAVAFGVALGLLAAGVAVPLIGHLSVLAVFVVFVALYYGGWSWNFQRWYFLSAAFAGAVGVGLVGGLMASAAVVGAGALGLSLWACLTGLDLVRSLPRGDGGVGEAMFVASVWVRENLPADAVVGSFNAGILGFYADRTVVNLDGVMNDEAAAAVRARSLLDYMDRRAVAFLVDFAAGVERYRRYMGGEHGTRITPLKTLGGDWHDSAITVYRVEPRAVGSAGVLP